MIVTFIEERESVLKSSKIIENLYQKYSWKSFYIATIKVYFVVFSVIKDKIYLQWSLFQPKSSIIYFWYCIYFEVDLLDWIYLIFLVWFWFQMKWLIYFYVIWRLISINQCQSNWVLTYPIKELSLTMKALWLNLKGIFNKHKSNARTDE